MQPQKQYVHNTKWHKGSQSNWTGSHTVPIHLVMGTQCKCGYPQSRRSEVNSGQCTPIQPDSAHYCTFTYCRAPKFLPKQFLYIMDTLDSILMSVAAEMVAFQ